MMIMLKYFLVYLIKTVGVNGVSWSLSLWGGKNNQDLLKCHPFV